jgi:hypothetical protein
MPAGVVDPPASICHVRRAAPATPGPAAWAWSELAYTLGVTFSSGRDGE